jgi:hypothetical protein
MKDNENISKKITWDEKRNFRFNKYFEYLGITQDEFALKIGYPQSNINAILNNKRALGEKIINTYIIPNCPELNTEWLRTGEGEMLKEEKKYVEEVSPIPYDNYMEVEYADLSTVAGRLGGYNPATLPEMKRRLIPKEFDRGNYLVVRVDGDSMDDGTSISIPDGTEILIKEYHLQKGEKLPIRGNLFVIVSTEGTVFKQIIEHNTEEGYIICHSYNQKYKDYKINLSEVLQIFIYRKIVSFRPSIPEINR